MHFEHLDWIVKGEMCEVDLTRSSLPPPEVSFTLKDVPRPPPLAGLEELREALAERYSLDPQEVLITSGASEANLLAFFILKERCQQVAVETPVYHPLRAIPRLLSIPVYELKRNPGEDFRVDFSTYGGGGVVLSHLHNPTGVPLREEERRYIGELEAPLLVDEVYGSFHPGKPVAALFPGAISTSSISKSAGGVGLRVGWFLSDRDTVKRALEIKNTISYMVPAHSQIVALKLLQEEERHVREWSRTLKENHRELSRWARGRGMYLPGEGTSPVTFLLTPQFPDTRDLSETLIRRFSIATIPGEVFQHPGGLRLFLGGKREEIKRFEEAMDEIIDEKIG